MAKVIIQIVVQGLQVLGRSFGRALRQEFEASQQAARARASSSQQNSSGTSSPFGGAQVSLDEAMKILNISKLDAEQVQKNYDHLFNINDKAKGGSFYLQSKVVRAKERIDAEIAEQSQESTKPPNPDDGRGT